MLTATGLACPAQHKYKSSLTCHAEQLEVSISAEGFILETFHNGAMSSHCMPRTHLPTSQAQHAAMPSKPQQARQCQIGLTQPGAAQAAGSPGDAVCSPPPSHSMDSCQQRVRAWAAALPPSEGVPGRCFSS